MKTRGSQATALIAAIGIAFAMPLAVFADPPTGVWSGDGAAPVPHIPGPFAGAPTNDDRSYGQFAATFDSTGHLVAVGRPAEPPATIAVVTSRSRRQVFSVRGNGRPTAASETTFANFRAQLRTLGLNTPPAPKTAQH